MNIGQVLSHHAKYRSTHLAFVCDGDKMNYFQLNESVNQIANALLRNGVRKGDKVTLLLQNCRELWELYWAISKIGAVIVPLSPLLRGEGLVNQINNADTALLITTYDNEHYITPIIEKLKIRKNDFWVIGGTHHYTDFYTEKQASSVDEPDMPSMDPEDLFNIIYSSGTTGQPKGIMHSHRIRSYYMALFGSYFRMTPESVVLHSGSIIFNGSFLTTMPVMFHGGTFILHKSFDAQNVLKDIKKYEVTHTILVPSQIIAALQYDTFTSQHIPSLECILSVGAPLNAKHKNALNDRIPAVFYELYGLTEGFITILDKHDFHKKTGSVGKPPPFFDMRIVDESGFDLNDNEIGEIVGRGPILMQGYYKDTVRTEQTVKNGWLFTGDLGYRDSDGFLYLVDRKKDMIISGSVNVYPNDIEKVIIKNDAILEVAVIGVEDAQWGETPIAAIVLKKGVSVTSDDLKSWINENVEARFHKVSDVMILDELPRNVAGKVLKTELRDLYNGKYKAKN